MLFGKYVHSQQVLLRQTGHGRNANLVNMCIHNKFSLGRQDMEEMLIW